MHPLDGIRAKLDRGDYHVKTLKRETDRIFFKRKNPPAFGIRQEFRPQDQSWCLFVAAVDPLPKKLGLIIGDAFHNFRSALDQLVFELAFIDNGGTETGLDRTAFPASLCVENFDGSYVQAKMLAGLKLPRRRKIKRFQPYHGWHGEGPHPLALLDDLSNDDKHRLVQPVLIAPEGVQIGFASGWQGHNCHARHPVKVGIGNFIGRPLVPDAPLLTVAPMVVTGPNPEMPVNCDATIVMGLRDGTAIQRSLDSISEFTRTIVEAFVPDFETRKAKRLRDKPRFGRFPPSTDVASVIVESGGLGVMDPVSPPGHT